MQESFARFASRAAMVTGSSWAFLVALTTILIWAVSGPLFHFSNTWQLVINTGTTIITFLMVFLIQNSQNRDSMAIQLKLDELIRAVNDASDSLIDIEEDTDAHLKQMRETYRNWVMNERKAAGDASGEKPSS